MRARRTFAQLAAAGAMVAATAGGALVAPGLAAAAPAGPYPAPAPSVTINSAAVTLGQSVRATGTGFAIRELVAVRIRTRSTLGPTGKGPTITQGAGPAWTDRSGAFRDRVNFSVPGYATVTFTGMKSHKSASVTVRVLGWRHGWPVFWRGISAGTVSQGGAGASAATAATNATLATKTVSNVKLAAHETSNTGGVNGTLVAAALAAVALVGSALVTLQVRRRREHPTA